MPNYRGIFIKGGIIIVYDYDTAIIKPDETILLPICNMTFNGITNECKNMRIDPDNIIISWDEE